MIHAYELKPQASRHQEGRHVIMQRLASLFQSDFLRLLQACGLLLVNRFLHRFRVTARRAASAYVFCIPINSMTAGWVSATTWATRTPNPQSTRCSSETTIAPDSWAAR